MKFLMSVAYGVGGCAAVAAGVWLSTNESANAADNAAPQSMVSVDAERTASGSQASGFWTWGNEATSKTNVNKASASKANKSLDMLMAQAMRASNTLAPGDDAREKLRKLAQEDTAVMTHLIHSYEKEPNSQVRQLIVSMLANVEKPEVLAFSKRLASSSDAAQRKDGFIMLQNLSSDSPDTHPIILQALSGEKSPDVIMLALAALRPPADAQGNASQTGAQAKDAAAIVAQLQNLTRNADPNIRLQSILQLAQWDKTDSSEAQWSQALTDQSPQVRQAAVTAIAQAGTQSAVVKTALLGLASNPNENKDVRGNALQILERFTLSQDEAANFSQLRSQILGS